MIGEDDGSVALGNASHGHMEDAVRSLDVMLLQPEKENQRRHSFMHVEREKVPTEGRGSGTMTSPLQITE